MLNFKNFNLFKFTLLILLISLFNLNVNATNNENDIQTISLIDQPTLLISTLDGTLYALDKHTGKIKWKLKDEPLVKLPDMKLDKSNQTLNFADPLLLPDPKDGSLYLYNGFFIKNQQQNKQKNDQKQQQQQSNKKENEQFNQEDQRDILEKMPFTINELISSSPCRSSTGLLYTGKKSDSWLIVDSLTGRIVETLNADSPFCPREDAFSKKENRSDIKKENLLMIGKTRFNLNIFNLNSHSKHWNLTVIDYTSTAAFTKTQSDYDLLHLTSASSGKIVTYDLESSELIWKNQLSSPIIAIFEFNLNLAGKVTKIPFSTVGTNARKKSEEQKNFIEDENDDLSDIDKLRVGTMHLSIYVGKDNNLNSLYTLSSYVGMEKQLISPKLRRMTFPLIEGPLKENEQNNTEDEKNDNGSNIYESSYLNLLVYGFYEFPDFSNIQILPQLVLNHLRDNLLNSNEKANLIDKSNSSTDKTIPFDEPFVLNTQFFLDFSIIFFSTIGVTLTASYVVYIRYVNVNKKTSKQIISKDGWKQIGKISFDPNHIIGRGSGGTFIFKGLFENRQEIAVKRVISQVFLVTDREIELLSKLQHPNLVRYFITEFDDQFKYIAIELAEISLADYIEKLDTNNLNNEDYNMQICENNKQILYETCLGISHLHSLNIIHRDIKPQNILLTIPNSSTGKRKVLITDFGLSKIIADTHSFSVDQICTKNFLLGTEGWTAPEIIKLKLDKTNELKEQIRSNSSMSSSEQQKIDNLREFDASYLKSKSIDIFSLGCVFYYVLTKGKHPFGEQITRQSRIFENKPDLKELMEEDKLLQFNLIEKMLSYNSKERPTIETILKHPLFWNESRQLQFFLCVSDRIEKPRSKEKVKGNEINEDEKKDEEILKNLEFNKGDVIKGDWKRYISQDLHNDLKGYRAYQGTKVKDLLRAIRNKRNHYRELTEEVKIELGSIPNEFCRYFTSRFPRLLIHCYIAMQDYKTEDIFYEFYDQECDWDFRFNALPRTGTKWFETFNKKDTYNIGESLNSSPIKKRLNNDSNLFAPNGFFNKFN